MVAVTFDPATATDEEGVRTRKTPVRCPICSGRLVTRWVGVTTHSRRGYRARAYPVHVCPACDVAVQIRRVVRPTHATRAAARNGQARKIRTAERRFAALVRSRS